MDKEFLTTFDINEEVEKIPITVIAKEEVFDIKKEVENVPIAIIIKKGGKRACKNRNNVKKTRSK